MTAFHYTDLLHFPFILGDGFIAPSRHIRAWTHGDAGRGVTWFTTMRRIDPSASAVNAARHGIPRLRLGVPLEITRDWREVCREAGWSGYDIDFAARIAGGAGAVKGWRAVLGPVPLSSVAAVEVLRPGEVWAHPGEIPYSRDGDHATVLLDDWRYDVHRRVEASCGEFVYRYQRRPCSPAGAPPGDEAASHHG
jgi:hypothetical protein